MVEYSLIHRLPLLLVLLLAPLFVAFSAADVNPQLGLPLTRNEFPLASVNRKGYYVDSEFQLVPSSRIGRTRKVAIIGAGPSGTSAAYFLKTASDHLASLTETSDKLQVTIYERNTRIGGRTAVAYPYDDPSKDPIELGASIFADVNLNMRRAVREFGLETGAQNGMSGQIGIWDGQQFLFEGDQSSWWTSAKFFLRYGYSAITTQTIVQKQLAYFSGLYRPRFLHSRSRNDKSVSGYPWSSVADLVDAINATSLVSTTGMSFFKEKRVSELFIEEMVEAATRVNYAQDTDQIHGFGALVSLAATGATGVKAGNYRIFEEFAHRSGAKILTGVEGQVTGIVKYKSVNLRRHLTDKQESKNEDETLTQWYIGTKAGEGETYDAVIIATPWHNSGITLLNTKERVKAKPFVHLHVTLLTTKRASPDPEYFGMGSQDKIPTTILTSDESVRRAREKKNPTGDTPPQDPGQEPPVSAENQLKKPHLEFFSLNYLRSVTPPDPSSSSDSSSEKDGKDKEYVVKIFSSAAISDETLKRLFNDTISWVRRQEWDSYPFLAPTDRFPHIEVDEGLYFSNAMESLVSTMETSTVAAKNTVALLMQKWFGDEFVNGKDCKYDIQDELRDSIENKNWAGWGCDSG
ncbi:related to Prenylcysteine oxidase precursor [Melanopsichium pennsylvanicum]|uniref:Related to Prenylcysteine oxidase n=2 Tax=Melanopsichium pennsylvanicum TaxID=63383 RepID=A0AAJ4XL18_9BASI|nr:related to Prenylcysteine oxidase precursor [Melanopsichium pennsylvanicum 4]SNX83901.1 related to Prenylcysteine oxidase precursor [Melanopsichium pennsylvanicum]